MHTTIWQCNANNPAMHYLLGMRKLYNLMTLHLSALSTKHILLPKPARTWMEHAESLLTAWCHYWATILHKALNKWTREWCRTQSWSSFDTSHNAACPFMRTSFNGKRPQLSNSIHTGFPLYILSLQAQAWDNKKSLRDITIRDIFSHLKKLLHCHKIYHTTLSIGWVAVIFISMRI